MTICPRCMTRMIRSSHMEQEPTPGGIYLIVVHTSECPACSVSIKAIIPQEVPHVQVKHDSPDL